MQLLYTGATKQDAEQLISGLSLGGFVSKSVIPNDGLSNVFSTASLLSIQNKRRESKMIALKNNGLGVATGLSFTFSTESDSICNYKVAFVSPTVNSGISCFEQIINSAALPYYATFQDIANGSVFNIASLAKDAYLGIWLMREYNYQSSDLKKKTDAEWQAIFEASIQSPNLIERLTFTLDYT